MNIVVQSSIKTLQKAKSLLDNLSDEQLCNATVPPYHSSIGTHIRHIFDFYERIFDVNTENQIDLTARSRNSDVEEQCDCAKEYLNLIVNKLNSFDYNMDRTVTVIDDLGLGTIKIPYTYGALLSQANSHAIHHYAIINYIFDCLGIVFTDNEFGYNPTTPKKISVN